MMGRISEMDFHGLRGLRFGIAKDKRKRESLEDEMWTLHVLKEMDGV